MFSASETCLWEIVLSSSPLINQKLKQRKQKHLSFWSTCANQILDELLSLISSLWLLHTFMFMDSVQVYVSSFHFVFIISVLFIFFIYVVEFPVAIKFYLCAIVFFCVSTNQHLYESGGWWYFSVHDKILLLIIPISVICTNSVFVFPVYDYIFCLRF